MSNIIAKLNGKEKKIISIEKKKNRETGKVSETMTKREATTTQSDRGTRYTGHP